MKFSNTILLAVGAAAAPQLSSSISDSSMLAPSPPAPAGTGMPSVGPPAGPAANGTVTAAPAGTTSTAALPNGINVSNLAGLISTLDSVVGTSFVNSIVSEVESIYLVGSTATGAQGSAYRSLTSELPQITGSLLSYVTSVYGPASSELSSLNAVTSTATGSALSAAQSSISSLDSSVSSEIKSQWNSITSQYSGVLSSLGVSASSTGASTYTGAADSVVIPSLGLFASFVLGLALYL